MSKIILSFALLLAFVCVEAQVPMDFLGSLSYTQDMSDVWGFEKNGSEYAIATTFTGTSFVDVTDPTNPVELFFVSGPNSFWRDAKDFNQDYVYVINETGGGLQIFDLTNFPAVSYTHLTLPTICSV